MLQYIVINSVFNYICGRVRFVAQEAKGAALCPKATAN